MFATNGAFGIHSYGTDLSEYFCEGASGRTMPFRDESVIHADSLRLLEPRVGDLIESHLSNVYTVVCEGRILDGCENVADLPMLIMKCCIAAGRRMRERAA
jgi:hypothetical protein